MGTQPVAIMGKSLGPPEGYDLVPVSYVPLQAGEVRVAIRSVAVSYVDILIASGAYQVAPAVPYIPGSEAAGHVVEVGHDVGWLKPDDAVVITSLGGLFAQEITINAGSVRRLPAGMSFDEGAALPISYSTAWHALVDRAFLRSGETLLVLGAGGAVGLAAIQVGRYLGAYVIACASSADKRALANSAGAQVTVPTAPDGWRKRVWDAAEGRPIDVVFDPVGGSLTESAFRAIGWRGRHLIVGFPAGITSVRTNLLLLKGAGLIGVDVRQFAQREPQLASDNMTNVFNLATDGVFRPAIGRVYNLADYRIAMADVAAGKTVGRVILDMTTMIGR